MGRKILLVEDEERLNRLITTYLEREGYRVIRVHDGEEAWNLWQIEDAIDLVILDIMLPGIDGWALCRRIRRDSEVPLILLTARAEEDDRIMGFELGADDYVTKPFSPRELVLRVKALLKRVSGTERDDPKVKIYGVLRINPESREVSVKGQTVDLTPKEYELLMYLVNNARQVLNRDVILDRVWGYDYFGSTRTVDTHIKNLREKLFKANGVLDYIKTVWGVGYKFEVTYDD